MEDLKIDYSKLIAIAPNAWKDVEKYYQTNFASFSVNHTLQSLPFDMSIGIYLHYFIENGVDWDVNNTDYQLLPDTLLDVFENYEKVISHYS